MDIKAALTTLDSFDDDHWTADGMPAIAAVSTAFGDKVTRKEITEADPLFSRELAGQLDDVTPDPVEEPEPEPVSDLDKLRNERDELELESKQIRHGVENANKRIKENEKRLDEIHDAMIILDPPLTQAQGIRAFINASNEARAKRHGVAQRVAASLPASVAKTKAPIDEAFARRSKRGGHRPVR